LGFCPSFSSSCRSHPSTCSWGGTGRFHPHSPTTNPTGLF
jgi:hypothetical protein